MYGFTLYLLGRISKTKFKQYFFSFLKGQDNIDVLIDEFWSNNRNKIKTWYHKQKSEQDIIISASPNFLLEPICNQLNVKYLVASIVDKNTGEFDGENCYAEEKVHRLKKEFDSYNIEVFYSDSYSDQPLANLATVKYFVQKDNLLEWSISSKPNREPLLEFIYFIIIGGISTVNGIVFASFFSLIASATTAFVLGYIISLYISYLLNSRYTFNEALSISKLFRFCIAYIPNFIIQNFIVIIFVDFLNWNQYIAYMLAAILGILVTFFIIKRFTFYNK